jgi:hypothetical protein
MDHCQLNIARVENGYTMSLSYEKDGKYKDEMYIATTAAKLKKMVSNAIKLMDKETVNAD